MITSKVPRYRVTADRCSASRSVRYIEGTDLDAAACKLCVHDRIEDRRKMAPTKNVEG